eukprot:gb/GECG01011982.1/.p1 GENE.gb/GECG01011982.1/~~gb/GECG01011982.1/.p1  ORF type:complete len:1166 (+),score=197.18 gb/GECG01011982.1/:1-3498(+)
MTTAVPQNNKEFANLLSQCQSPDNSIRKEAEKHYLNLVEQSPDATALALSALLQEETQVAIAAAVFLYKVVAISSDSRYKLSSDVLNKVEHETLQVFQKSEVSALKRKIATVLSQIAGGRTQPAEWTQVLNVAKTSCKSENEMQQSSGFYLLYRLILVLRERIKESGLDLMPVIELGLSSSNSETKSVAVQCICEFLSVLQGKEEISSSAHLMRPVFNVIMSMLQEGQEEEVQTSLESIIDVAHANPRLLKDVLADVGNTMTWVAQSTSIPSAIRLTAVELMVTLAEAHGGMVRKSGGTAFTSGAVKLMLMMMSEIEDTDTAAWCKREYDAEGDPSGDSEADSVAYAAEGAFDRFCDAMGEDVIAKNAVTLSLEMLQHQDSEWVHRRASLVAFGLLSHSCSKALRPEIDTLVETTLKYAQDSHPRVRHAAIGSLGMYAESFSKKFLFQKRFNAQVLPCLANAMKDNIAEVTRVSAHAATALINFCSPSDQDECCPAELITPHLDQLMSSLLSLLQCNTPSALGQSLSALAVVAKSAGDKFAAYYDQFMPGVKSIVKSPPQGEFHGNSLQVLRGKAMECAALMGQAVGKEKFNADARELLEFLVQHQRSVEDQGTTDVSYGYSVETLTRIANVLKEDFAPYLDFILPSILRNAEREVDISAEDVDSAEPNTSDNNQDSVTVEIKGLGYKRISMQTSALEEKLRAISVLNEYADEMKHHFGPYAERVVNVAVPLMQYKWNAEVRSKSCYLFSKLFACLVSYERQNNQIQDSMKVLESGLFPLVKALQNEHNDESRAAEAEALADTLLACLIGGMDEDETTSPFKKESSPVIQIPVTAAPGLVSTLIEAAKGSIDRRWQAIEKLQSDEDADDEAYNAIDQSLEVEEELMRNVVDAIGYILKAHRDQALPVFEQHVVPLFSKLLSNDVPEPLRFNAICSFDDAIEWCGDSAHKFAPQILPTLVDGVTSDNELLRQACMYAVGQLAMIVPDSLIQHLDDLSKRVVSVITARHAREEDNNSATENAISTLLKLLVYVAPRAPDSSFLKSHSQSYYKLWLKQLPLLEDEEEAQFCHGFLVERLLAGDTTVLGEGFSNLGIVLSILAKILEKLAQPDDEDDIELLTEDRKSSLKQWLQAAMNNQLNVIPTNVLQEAWKSVSPEQQGYLQQFAQ